MFDKSQKNLRYNVLDLTSQQPEIETTQLSQVVVELDQCALTSVPGYIVYSACGSFWVPMLGMIVFYWKIYKTAVAATDAVNRGFVEQKTTGLFANASGNSDNTSCRLRVHRGGSAAAATTAASTPRSAPEVGKRSSVGKLRHSAGCITELLPRASDHRNTVARHSVDAPILNRSTAPAASATPSTPNTTGTTTPTGGTRGTCSQRTEVTSYPVPTIVITSSTSCHGDAEHSVVKNTNIDDVKSPGGGGDVSTSAAVADVRQQDAKRSSTSSAGAVAAAFRGARTGKRQSRSCDDVNIQQLAGGGAGNALKLHDTCSAPPSTRTSASSVTSAAEKRTSLIASRFAKLHIISQLRSLNKEKKAAKTVGIIVGCFIICWAPFFTVYLAEAFCRQCTPAILFNIFFWLGYCNSAANPFIYGLCSRDFRYAFQKFLRCRYRRTKPALRHSANSQMMTMLQSLTMQVVAGGTVNAAANVSAAKTNRRRHV